jgi:bacillopeptidase F
MGTMVGWSPTTGDTVGVAIDAEWIAAKTICSSPHTTNSIAGFQWAMDPDGNPGTINDMPDAISNSWYDPSTSNECAGIYKTTLDAVEAAGIAVVFSAGNSGPGTSTITRPKNINTDEVNVFCVANINGASYLGGNMDPITSSSSRGPSLCGGTGSFLIKPEVSAPGTSVRSAYNGGGYANLTGTSMASPHVAGAIALLRQFAPNLTGKQIKLALYNTAKDLGTPGEDNTYGKGLIDVYAAFLSLGTPDTTPPDPVADLDVVDTTSNSLTITWTVPNDTSMNGVTGYDIRYSTSPINDTTAFNNAAPLIFTGQPGSTGASEILVVEGLGRKCRRCGFPCSSGDVPGSCDSACGDAS